MLHNSFRIQANALEELKFATVLLETNPKELALQPQNLENASISFK